jgi:hypothetical protein
LHTTKTLSAVALFLFAATASAQSPNIEKEPAAVVELGASGNWNVKDGSSSFGPTVAIEFTPIKNWLELEAGVTPSFARHATEWDTDLLFKKPWDISRKMEFMLGVGPAWVHTNRPEATRNSASLEVAPDLMFWPSAKHKFGWYIEPSYEYNFGRGREQSLGVTVGLLIAIR